MRVAEYEPDPREIDREELACEVRIARQARNRCCDSCGLRGTHRAGCPDAPEPVEVEEHAS